MKGWKDLFHEPVSNEYRKKVLDTARAEFATQFERRSLLAQWLKIGALTAAGLGAAVFGGGLVKKEETQNLGVLNVDPEMLENLDWLEDLEVLNHLDELTERGES